MLLSAFLALFRGVEPSPTDGAGERGEVDRRFSWLPAPPGLVCCPAPLEGLSRRPTYQFKLQNINIRQNRNSRVGEGIIIWGVRRGSRQYIALLISNSTSRQPSITLLPYLSDTGTTSNNLGQEHAITDGPRLQRTIPHLQRTTLNRN